MLLFDDSAGICQNTCRIDAFSCTFKSVSLEDIIGNILCLEHLDWQCRDYGRYGYKKSLQFGAICLLYDGRIESMGICLELRGQGCSELAQLTQNDSIFYELLSHPSTTLTRIDIAIDDYAGLVDMGTVVNKIERGEIRTRMRATTECKGLAETTGHTVYVGSASSNCRIRIYDKQAQMDTAYPWVRTEMVLRHEDAVRFQHLVVATIDQSSSYCDEQIASLGTSVLYGKLCFIEPNNANITRCSVSSWWDELLDADPIRLSELPKEIPTIKQAAEWLRKQVAPTLVLLLCILGPEWFESVVADGHIHIDMARAITWLQQMEAIGMSPTVNPCTEDMVDNIRTMFSNYYCK